MKKMIVTPRFNAHEIVNEVITKEWFLAQNAFLSLGKKMHKFMRRFVNNNRHRAGGTGRLSRSINFEVLSTTAKIHWGIGNINRLVPYWHVIATGRTISGKRFRPGGGEYIPIEFTDGFAKSSKRSDGKFKGAGGTGRVLNIKSRNKGERKTRYIRPIPFIEVTRAHLKWEIEKVLARLSQK